MKRKFLTVLFVLLTIGVLAGCSTATTAVQQTAGGELDPDALIAKYEVTLVPKTGTVVGKLFSKNGIQTNNTPVFLAQVFWDENHEKGAFALSGTGSPSTLSKEDGVFIISGVEPGDYTIIVGEIIGTSVVVKDEKGDARVITIEADKVLTLDDLEVK